MGHFKLGERVTPKLLNGEITFINADSNVKDPHGAKGQIRGSSFWPRDITIHFGKEDKVELNRGSVIDFIHAQHLEEVKTPLDKSWFWRDTPDEEIEKLFKLAVAKWDVPPKPQIIVQDPPKVTSTSPSILNKLFEGTDYSVDTLLPYPHRIGPNKGIKLKKMTAPIVKGDRVNGQGNNIGSFIAMKLHQPNSEAKLCAIYSAQDQAEFSWRLFVGKKKADPRFSTTMAGAIPLIDEPDGLSRLHLLLKDGIVQDLNGTIWSLNPLPEDLSKINQLIAKQAINRVLLQPAGRSFDALLEYVTGETWDSVEKMTASVMKAVKSNGESMITIKIKQKNSNDLRVLGLNNTGQGRWVLYYGPNGVITELTQLNGSPTEDNKELLKSIQSLLAGGSYVDGGKEWILSS